jgi:nucleotide-binding universal stress UspA family protein
MYENLMIGVDGREGGLDAGALPAVLAAPVARWHVVFVAGAPAHTGRGALGLAHGGLLVEERECETIVLIVEDSDWLDALADEVDLLVCGSRRNGPVGRLMLGSASDHLVRHVDVPLIVTAPVDSAAVARWQERHPEAGAYGTR